MGHLGKEKKKDQESVWSNPAHYLQSVDAWAREAGVGVGQREACSLSGHSEDLVPLLGDLGRYRRALSRATHLI